MEPSGCHDGARQRLLEFTASKESSVAHRELLGQTLVDLGALLLTDCLQIHPQGKIGIFQNSALHFVVNGGCNYLHKMLGGHL